MTILLATVARADMPGVLALVSKLDAQRVCARLEHRATCRVASNWPEFKALFESTDWDLAIVDPATGSSVTDPITHLAAVCAFFARRPLFPIVVVVSTAATQAGTGLIRMTNAHLLWTPVDEFGSLSDLTADIMNARPAMRILSEMAAPLSRLTGEVRELLFHLFEHPETFSGTRNLVSAAAMSRRKLYHEFEAAELAGPQVFIQAARVAKVYWMVGVQATTLKVAAHTIGAANDRTVRRQVRSFLQAPPGRLTTVSIDEAVERIVGKLVRTSAAPHGRVNFQANGLRLVQELDKRRPAVAQRFEGKPPRYAHSPSTVPVRSVER